MINRRFTYTDPTVSKIKIDNTNNFVWMAFNQDSSGICRIEKQAPFQPNQTYFTVEREIDSVKGMDLNSSNLFVIYEDDSLFAEKFSLTNPLTSSTQITIPAGITESPVDIIVDSSIYILIPGDTSGENAKILVYNTSLVLQETIDLTKSGATVTNATSFTLYSGGDLWVVTYNDPAEYIRVYQLSGGSWDFDIHSTI